MENKILNIIISTAWYKSDQIPGAGSFVEEQARLFQKKGHKVTILHPYLKGKFLNNIFNKKYDISTVNDLGINIIKVGISPVLPKARQFNYKVLTKICIEQVNNYIKANGKPDIIHGHAFFVGGLIGYNIATILNIPFFHTEHASSLITNPKQYTLSDKKTLRKAFKHAINVFFVSYYSRKQTINTLNLDDKNIEVLPNHISDSFFNSKNKASNTIFRYLIIGKLNENKNQLLALKSFKNVLERFPNSELVIAGEGDKEAELKNIAKVLTIEDKVIWKKTLSRNEVKSEIQSAHVILSCSKIETFGLTIVEAHANGKPTIATNSGGVRDTISSNNGIISEAEDQVFGNHMVYIQENYKSFKADEIKLQCFNLFSEDRVYDRIMKYYSTTK